jgi:hypothetical protein
VKITEEAIFNGLITDRQGREAASGVVLGCFGGAELAPAQYTKSPQMFYEPPCEPRVDFLENSMIIGSRSRNARTRRSLPQAKHCSLSKIEYEIQFLVFPMDESRCI